LDNEYDVRFDKKIDELKKNKSPLAKFVEQSDLKNYSKTLFNSLASFFENSKVLFVFSFFVFYSLIAIFDASNILFITILSIFSFINLTMLAIAFGCSKVYYAPTKIITIDGKTYDGRVIKHGDFIYLINKNKKYFINKDQVKIVEQDIMKQK
jgi:hypothetical protein